jgi:hypothetical protein
MHVLARVTHIINKNFTKCRRNITNKWICLQSTLLRSETYCVARSFSCLEQKLQ